MLTHPSFQRDSRCLLITSRIPSIHSQKGNAFSLALCFRIRVKRYLTSRNYTLYCKSLTHSLCRTWSRGWVLLGSSGLWPLRWTTCFNSTGTTWKVLLILWGFFYRAACRRACSAAPGSSLGWWWRRTASWEPGTAETTLPAGGWGRTSGSEDEERKNQDEH